MDISKKVEYVYKPPTEEVLTKKDLETLFEEGRKIDHYIGFEISGLIHLGTGLMAGAKIADFQKAGIGCRVFLADWHAWINNKFGGDMETIQKVAVGYFKEGMAISVKVMGGEPDKVEYILGSRLYENNPDYWATVINVSKKLTLARVRKSITIMGRQQGEEVNFAQLIYPPMQVADIFQQDLNMVHSGMDQRKAHVIAREVAGKIGKEKPVAVHHRLLLGLQQPPIWPVEKKNIRELWSQMKMSKSIPKSAVFIHDSSDEIKDKLNRAFCPAKNIDFNPVLDWAQNIIFREKNELLIKRSSKFGGDVTFNDYPSLENAFEKGNLHPLDLKNAVAEKLIEILKPARDHFEKPRFSKMLDELKNVSITR
ncbi:MAG: tyrosine--tRNA ligase [Candidatus Methanofastidiosia archaeon]